MLFDIEYLLAHDGKTITLKCELDSDSLPLINDDLVLEEVRKDSAKLNVDWDSSIATISVISVNPKKA